MHNLAQIWWCEMYSVLKSRRNELEFFGVYLADRLRLALALSRIPKMPTARQAILEAAAARLPGAEVEQLLAEAGWPAPIAQPAAEDRRSTDCIVEAEVADSSSSRYLYAHRLEATRGEHYPRYRWSFPAGRYVLVGEPDGLTSDLVYEFKTVRNRYFCQTSALPIACAQADLYGCYFGRGRKRVQIHVRDEDAVETLDAAVDKERASLTIERFTNVDSGQPPTRPKAFKCKKCDEAEGCSVRQETVQ